MTGTDGGISGLFANTQGARIARGEVPAAAIAGNQRLQELSKAAEPLRAYLKKYGDPYTVVVVRQDCATEAQAGRYVRFTDDANEWKALEEEIMALLDNG